LDALCERLEDFRERIAGSVAAMPSHADFLEDFCAEPMA
jgi:hypothetical protein